MKKIELPSNLKTTPQSVPPLQLKTPGNWLILNDVHIPHHHVGTVETALNEAAKNKVVGIILNGDILDSAEISSHDKEMDMASYQEEIRLGLGFLEVIRKEFPKAQIVYKAGNHEERLDKYIMKHAPAFRGLEGFNLPSLLHMKELDVQWVQDARIIRLGILNVFHGHEFRGGSGNVNVARWLLLRCGGGVAACCGHFHRSDAAGSRNVEDYHNSAWGIGCACDLRPKWCPQNQWNHGFAIVELGKDGNFEMENFKVLRHRSYLV